MLYCVMVYYLNVLSVLSYYCVFLSVACITMLCSQVGCDDVLAELYSIVLVMDGVLCVALGRVV